ncbi:hypothetical protein ACFQU2_37420 [Siccirubricoccus deserti]
MTTKRGLASHHALNTSRAKPQSARSRMQSHGRWARTRRMMRSFEAAPHSRGHRWGPLGRLKKAQAERVLNAELDHHLEGGEPNGRAKSRSGH